MFVSYTPQLAWSYIFIILLIVGLTLGDYVKWEEWWYKYQEWLKRERAYERWAEGEGGTVSISFLYELGCFCWTFKYTVSMMEEERMERISIEFLTFYPVCEILPIDID